MSFFCLFCIPVFYLFRRSVFPGQKGSILALLFGGVAVAVQYFLGPLVVPGGFGFSRWVSGLVDVVSVPVLVPFGICLLIAVLRKFSGNTNFANFTLLWIVPLAAFSSITASAPPSPIPLVLVPILWIAQAEGMAFFAVCIMRNPRWYVIIPLVLIIAALPVVATTAWWAFFSQQTIMGYLFLALSIVPVVISMAVQFHSMGKGKTPSMLEQP
jgi:hypothetical protein